MSYDQYCYLQTTVGKQLINFIKPHIQQSQHTIDLGCGTGIVTQILLQALKHVDFHALDISTCLINKTKARLINTNTQIYEADFDALPTYAHGFNLMFSNMALQWSVHLHETLKQLSMKILPKGIIAFSIPLAETLTEIRMHYALNNFPSELLINAQLKNSGHEIIFFHKDKFIFYFDNTLAALKSIKHVGANFVNHREHKGLRGKSFIQRADLKQLTYVIGYFIARKIA